MGCSERRKEIKRRRCRRHKLKQLGKRLKNATVSERTETARKVRAMTSGADVIIGNWELAEVDR